jgi:hypothetical protein
MSRLFLIILPCLLLGCGEDKAEDPTCEALCSLLVQDCSFAAFPSSTSCDQGCAFSQSEGADVAGLLECVSSADECDPFAIAECQNAFGS